MFAVLPEGGGELELGKLLLNCPEQPVFPSLRVRRVVNRTPPSYLSLYLQPTLRILNLYWRDFSPYEYILRALKMDKLLIL